MRNMTPFLQYVMKFNIISFHFCFLVSKSLEGTGAPRTFDLGTSDVHLAPGGMLAWNDTIMVHTSHHDKRCGHGVLYCGLI